jgi:hypothetical protein
MSTLKEDPKERRRSKQDKAKKRDKYRKSSIMIKRQWC